MARRTQRDETLSRREELPPDRQLRRVRRLAAHEEDRRVGREQTLQAHETGSGRVHHDDLAHHPVFLAQVVGQLLQRGVGRVGFGVVGPDTRHTRNGGRGAAFAAFTADGAGSAPKPGPRRIASPAITRCIQKRFVACSKPNALTNLTLQRPE